MKKKKKIIPRKNHSTYFLDECITIHWSHQIQILTNNYELSVSKVGPGANDNQVLNYAIKHNQTLVTGDIRLTLWAILKNHPVVFVKRNGERFLIQANSQKLKTLKIADEITQFLSDHGTIIIP